MISPAADTPSQHEQKVKDYVAAYNRRDIDAMLNMVSEDIQWLSVDGDKITVETKGKGPLRESLAGYFKSSPSAQSTLEWIHATSARVAAHEKSTWKTKSGMKSQTSLSVYEFHQGLITRVYYYPAEK